MLIFLIGFMGSGKSYWGKIWAKECEWSFYDLDALVEQKEKQSISNIFEENGEAYFREVETIQLQSLKNNHSAIIACGGGTPCFNDNMTWMNENGMTVYLSASPHQLAEHIMKDQKERPLLKDIGAADLLMFIEKKLQERHKYYLASKLHFPITDLNVKTIHQIIDHTLL